MTDLILEGLNTVVVQPQIEHLKGKYKHKTCGLYPYGEKIPLALKHILKFKGIKLRAPLYTLLSCSNFI